MTSRAQRTTSIVVGFDFSPLAQLAIREAARIADRSACTTIHVVTVLEDIAQAANPPPDVTEGIRKRVVSALRALGSVADVHIVSHLRAGDPAGEILSLAEDVEASLILIGTHGRRGVQRLVLGSVAERVVRDAACPVTVMRPVGYAQHPERTPEPPCRDCLAVRQASDGATLWCEPHAKPWAPPHRYTYSGGTLHPFHPDGLGPS